MERVEGKRTAPAGGKKWLPFIIAGAVAAVLVGAYLGLCAYAGGSTFLPNTLIAGVDVSGQTREQALSTLEESLAQRLSELSVSFTCQGTEYTVRGGEFTAYPEDAVTSALNAQSANFLLRGINYLTHLTGEQRYEVSLALASTPRAVTQAISDCADEETQTTWTFENNQLILHKGVTGQTIDTAALAETLTERMELLLAGEELESETPVEAEVITAPPAEPDFTAIRSEICVEAADAYLDPDTYEIVPSVTGVDFDVDQARQLLEAAAEGTDVEVPIILTEPSITTADLEANLFKDVLGAGSTLCASPSERWYNIDLAASRVNGVILLPGEEFSYNDHCGPYTLDSGYKKAGTYQNGQSIDATAGGICQLSSTLYWVTLKANLEVTERHKHQFNGGYMPVIGTDATVWSDVYDFRFVNNTDYPIKIEAYQDSSHYLHVTIYGTDTTGIHGEPYSVTVSTVAYKNIYKPDESIPVGSAPQRDTNYPRYNGVTVDVYQKLVDADGNTVSTTFLYRNTYSSSDAVYYYNPADAARLGIDTTTGLMTLTPVTPTPSPSPSATATPETSASPSPSPSATATPETSASPSPAATPTPETSASPSPSPAATPSASPTAENSAGPGMEPTE